MLKRGLLGIQFLFALCLTFTIMIMYSHGEFNFENCVSVIVLGTLMLTTTTVANSNLLKTKILCSGIEEAVQENKDHLMFLIERRQKETLRALITESVMVVLVALFTTLSQLVFAKVLVITLIAHLIMLFIMFVTQARLNGLNKKSIG